MIQEARLQVGLLYDRGSQPMVRVPLVIRGSFSSGTRDFNSHNTIWGYDETNENGKAVENWMDIKNLELIHALKQPSSFNSQRHKRGYNPDLLFASQEIAPNFNKITLDAVSRSQHRPIALKISPLISPKNTYFKCRFNFGKANWKGFKAESDSVILRLKPKPENYDDNHTEVLIKFIILCIYLCACICVA